jgi:hypothetical protein
MRYGRTLRLFAFFTPFLVLYRVLLKTLFIDLDSGFYEGNPLWNNLFAIGIVLAAGGIVLTALLTKDVTTRTPRGNRLMEAATFGLGIVLLGTGLIRLLTERQSTTSSFAFHLLPGWLSVSEQILCVLSGVALILIAFVMWSGARSKEATGLLALIPAVWQTFLLVERFVSFRQVLTVSDQLLETLYLLSACLFFLFYARSLLQIVAGSQSLVAAALLTALFGFVSAVGQYAGMAVAKDASGPSPLLLPMMLTVSSYALIFVFRTLHTASKDPPL